MSKLADAILAADLHIRPGKPQSRTDDFQEAMWGKWHYILNLSEANEACPILVAGDVGQEAEWPNWLLRKFIKQTRETSDCQIFAIPGQHDLPNHNLNLWEKSAIGVLTAKQTIILLIREPISFNEGSVMLYPFPYGVQISKPKEKGSYTIAMAHDLVLPGKARGWKEGKGLNGLSLLKQFPEYDVILTGDNHKPFVVEYQGRFLVNPGSMMRSAADQIDHSPRVYLWYAEERRLGAVYLPIQPNVLNRDYIEREQDKEKRMEAFVQSIKPGEELKIKFEDNMKIHLRENPALPKVETKIWSSVV